MSEAPRKRINAGRGRIAQNEVILRWFEDSHHAREKYSGHPLLGARKKGGCLPINQSSHQRTRRRRKSPTRNERRGELRQIPLIGPALSARVYPCSHAHGHGRITPHPERWRFSWFRVVGRLLGGRIDSDAKCLVSPQNRRSGGGQEAELDCFHTGPAKPGIRPAKLPAPPALGGPWAAERGVGWGKSR